MRSGLLLWAYYLLSQRCIASLRLTRSVLCLPNWEIRNEKGPTLTTGRHSVVEMKCFHANKGLNIVSYSLCRCVGTTRESPGVSAVGRYSVFLGSSCSQGSWHCLFCCWLLPSCAFSFHWWMTAATTVMIWLCLRAQKMLKNLRNRLSKTSRQARRYLLQFLRSGPGFADWLFLFMHVCVAATSKRKVLLNLFAVNFQGWASIFSPRPRIVFAASGSHVIGTLRIYLKLFFWSWGTFMCTSFSCVSLFLRTMFWAVHWHDCIMTT